MDILRDTTQNLYRSTPDTDTMRQAADKTSYAETGPRYYAPVAVLPHHAVRESIPMSATATAPLPTAAPPAEPEAENRFARDFVDPRIGCAPIPHAFSKRVVDVCVALLVLLVSSPILLVCAALIKLTSPGPVVFRQIRVGRGGRLFWCYKLRSMCSDAESQKASLLHLNEASGPVFKIKSDPRITPVGKWLRKLSLDELPQLVNILQGHMSLVGPRPPVPNEVAQYSPRDYKRLSVQPGLTCLWQIGGRSNVSFDHWMELDLLYIETMSLRNDCAILLKTIPAVLASRGAH